MLERRSSERRDLIYYLRVLDRNNSQLIGYAANISTEGVMLIGKRPIRTAATLPLRIFLPGKIDGKKHLDFEAVSKWCRRNGNSDYFDCGLKLDGIAQDDLAIIERLCSTRKLESSRKLTAKRLFDGVTAFFGLLFLLPVFIVVGLALKLDSSGPVLFIANRVGKFGRPFRMYKFRTMTEPPGSNGPRVTAHDDPRVTRVGRLLRTTKLNELPQLLNVLKGEMSLVGPRPEYVEFVAHYSPEHREVLSVEPGITSLAAILYANEEDMLRFSDVTETYVRDILPDKLRLDLLYVRNRSLLLDVDILIQTVTVLIPSFRRAVPHAEDIFKGPFRLARQYLPWFAIDAVIALLSVSLAGVLWRAGGLFNVDLVSALIAAIAMTTLFSATNWLTGVQRIHWRYASPTDAIGVVISGSAATIIMLVANGIIPAPRFPAEMLIMAGIFAVGGFLIARYHRQIGQGLHGSTEGVLSISTAGRERVLIVGAGDAGQLTILLLRNNPAGRAFHVVGIVDDDPDLLGALLHRVRVLDVCERIPEIVREKDVGTIVFAIHTVDDARRDRLLRLCQETGARTVVVHDLLGTLHQRSLREEENQVAPGTAANDSQAEPSLKGNFIDLHDQIHLLADQARRGDIADVARGLDRLDKALDVRESHRFVEPPQRLQP